MFRGAEQPALATRASPGSYTRQTTGEWQRMLTTVVRPLSEGCNARSPGNTNETRKSYGQSEDFFSNSSNSRRSVCFARQQRPDGAYRNAGRSGKGNIKWPV